MKHVQALKVYGWTTFAEIDGRTVQCRCICAATSWAEVARVTGHRMSDLRHDGSITGNKQEIALATAEPSVLFACPINESFRDHTVYRKVTSQCA